MAENEKKGKLGDTDDRNLLSCGETESGSGGDLSGFDFDEDSKQGTSSLEDINLGSGSAEGLLALDKDPADSMILEFDKIITDGVEERPPRAPSKKTLQAKASLENKVYYHDDIMTGEGFRRVRGYCYTDGIKYILFANDKDGKPSIFVMSGYSLKGIVPKGKTMRGIQFVGEDNKVINSYGFFDQLARSYLGVDGRVQGRRGESIAPHNKYARVAFAYSVGYNPDDKENLRAKISSTINDANKVYGNMKADIEKNLCNGKTIARVSGDAAFDLCTWVCQVYRQRRGAEEPLELMDEGLGADFTGLESTDQPDVVSQEVQQISAEYAQTQGKKANPISAERQSRFFGLFSGKKKNKPKG